MVNPLPIILIAVIAGVVGWQTLVKMNPDIAEGMSELGNALSGDACKWSQKGKAVYMPTEGDCEPVAEMVAAPEILGELPAQVRSDIALTMVNPRAVGADRQILIQRRVQPGEVLTEGRAVPGTEGDKAMLFSGWSREEIRASCALLRVDFASFCAGLAVSGDRGPIWNGQSGLFTLHLTYSPIEPVGPLPEPGEPLWLSETRVTLAPQTPAQPAAAALLRATGAAGEACAKIRAETGNCLISEIYLDEAGGSEITLYSVSAKTPVPEADN